MSECTLKECDKCGDLVDCKVYQVTYNSLDGEVIETKKLCSGCAVEMQNDEYTLEMVEK